MHTNEELKAVLAKYWGYEGYLPNQERAMECALRGRDSIVVLPTGGGKSLCFQAPAVAMPGLAVVVSPLLSLMKDQVDALAECGISAGRIDSMQTPDERQEVFARIHNRSLKILYLSPERLLSEGLLPFLQSLDLSLIAIDEAHCVSMWGHDFRPEYRQLGRLKEVFPNVARHAYTATATEQVRRDIAVQLKLDSPEVIVGSFDRPNLIYKVERRADKLAQICQVLDRHKGESGIVYCLRRKDVDRMCDCLRTLGHNAAPYHAGMEDIDRKKNQDGFIKEKIDIIVATVAFGMGIDKSNVRYVIHSGMPKSLEHYQQESGRAGRDGLDAECVLFYGADDFMFWKRVLQDLEGEPGRIAFRKLRDMQDYADGITCRHRALVGYFGQKYEKDNCGACDVCLGNMDVLEDPLVTAQKILSCIVRLKQAFGAGYTAMVLTGSHEQRILQNHHHNLSTYGLMSDHTQKMVLDWIEQLVSQGYIWRTQEEYSVLNITEKGWQVLKGQETPRLLKPAAKPAKTAKVAEDSWEGVDRDLFEDLRQLRREIADSKGVPAFLVFGDASLRDMARKRPSSEEGFRSVHGVGDKKAREYGRDFVKAIATYCRENSVDADIEIKSFPSLQEIGTRTGISETKGRSFELFAKGLPVEVVAQSLGRAESTTYSYLEEFLKKEGITDPQPWVDEKTFKQVSEAARVSEDGRMRPIFDALDGTVSYNDIRVCITCLRNEAG